MVMGRRPDVPTASAPVTAVDAVGLAQQLGAALVRVPFRRPLRGQSNPAANVATAVTREVLRTFMGYSSSLPIDEFRSIEVLLDDLCRVVMQPVVASHDVAQRRTEFGGVPGILYTPKHRAPDGVILYLHGGGYIGTSPTMYSFFTARLCQATNCTVFVADYRLAPEFPFPAGVEDAAAALTALVELGAPPGRLLLAGDSGGGGLANSLLLEAPERLSVEPPVGLLLFSPEVDLLLDEPSVTENASRDILPWNIPTAAYLHGADATNVTITAVDADVAGFPPTFVCWGGDEMFRDPIRRFVGRLAAADVPHEAHEIPGMFHVFPILMPWATASRVVYLQATRFVRAVLEGAVPIPSHALPAVSSG
jgi:epsilon-lactone hydrolase